jgi:sugar O-acyltransferase (sialic acid O-acetyltransferase NeuD family)
MGANIEVPKKIIVVDSNTGRIAHEIITVLNWVMEEGVGTTEAFKPYRLIGYLDDDPFRLGEQFNGVCVVGKTEDAYKFDDCLFVIAGYATSDQPERGRSLFSSLELPHLRYETLVHPNSYISEYVTIGHGSVVCMGAKVMPNVTIGNHVMIYPNAVIDTEASISDFAIIGAGSYVGRNSVIRGAAFIAANVMIADNIEVGDAAVVRLGSVVYKSVGDSVVVIGNPAKPYMATMKMRKPFEVGL